MVFLGLGLKEPDILGPTPFHKKLQKIQIDI